MRKSIWGPVALLASFLGLMSSVSRADGQTGEELFRKVMARLLSTDVVHKDYPGKYLWPPRYLVKPRSQKELNAYASAATVHGATVDEKTGKLRPVVLVTEGMLQQVIKGDENSLAVIMGHELAHLTKGHVAGHKEETPFLFLAFSRDHELEADVEGLRYAVAAGYPYRVGVAKAFRAMRDRTRYTSFEGLSTTHPSWEDRLAFLDREQPRIWSSMSAFHNGTLFLELEQYRAADQCFRAVVAEFPDCYEAWADLGYSLLMRYCDGLESDDLRGYGIGQVVAGGFYARPASLESKARGTDDKLWKDAVKALNRALALKSDLAVPRANLGLAYLVHPEGKDARKAARYFQEALEHFQKDPELRQNRLASAALLINSAVADLALDRTDQAVVKNKLAGKVLLSLQFTPLVKTLEEALLYNNALCLVRSGPEGKRDAFRRLERYLSSACPDSAWWPLAWERYTALAKELKLPTQPRDELARRSGPALLRLVTSVAIGPHAVTLSEPIGEAVSRLGKEAGVASPLFPGSKIVRWSFADQGIDLLARDRVLAIFLKGSQAPPVVLQASGVGTRPQELRVGMAEAAARELLKGQRVDQAPRPVSDPRVGYQFFPELGLAVRFGGGRVEELVVAQIPRFSFAKR